MRRRMLFASLVVAIAVPLTANASTFKSGESYALGTAEIVAGNLYVAAGSLSLGGTVNGDAYAAGGNVTVTGETSQDLSVAGGSVSLLGPVKGDLRTAGGSLTIGGAVGGELIAMGGQIALLPSASVDGDAMFAGGNVTVSGILRNDLVVNSRSARIDGTVEGDVHVTAETLTLGPGAVIKGSLLQEGPNKAVLESGAVINGQNTFTYKEIGKKTPGAVTAVPPEAIGRAIARALFAASLLKFIALLVTAALATLWFTRRSRVIVDRTLGNFGTDLLTGFVTTVATPIVMLLLLVTLIGWYAFAVLAAFLSLAGIIGTVYAPVSLGAWVRRLATKGKTNVADWKSAALGAVLLAVAMFVPVVGWLFVAVFCMASFGSILRLAYDGLVVPR